MYWNVSFLNYLESIVCLFNSYFFILSVLVENWLKMVRPMDMYYWQIPYSKPGLNHKLLSHIMNFRKQLQGRLVTYGVGHFSSYCKLLHDLLEELFNSKRKIRFWSIFLWHVLQNFLFLFLTFYFSSSFYVAYY